MAFDQCHGNKDNLVAVSFSSCCYQTDLASGEWKNESASLAEYVEKLLMLSRAVDVLCATYFVLLICGLNCIVIH